MNQSKFYQRTKLFSDILYEIFNVESNYRTQLSLLNLKLIQIIQEHKNEFFEKKIEKRQTIVGRKSKNDIQKININHTIKSSKSKDNLISGKEDNPMIDKLMSENLQQFLTFYKKKHQLVSQEVSNLGIIIYNFSSSQKKYDNNEDLNDLEIYKGEFDINYIKLMKTKKQYFEKMKNLELLFHQEEENKKQLRAQNKKN